MQNHGFVSLLIRALLWTLVLLIEIVYRIYSACSYCSSIIRKFVCQYVCEYNPKSDIIRKVYGFKYRIGYRFLGQIGYRFCIEVHHDRSKKEWSWPFSLVTSIRAQVVGVGTRTMKSSYISIVAHRIEKEKFHGFKYSLGLYLGFSISLLLGIKYKFRVST